MISGSKRFFLVSLVLAWSALAVLIPHAGASAEVIEGRYYADGDKPAQGFPYLQGAARVQAEQAWVYYQKTMGQPMSQWASAEIRFPGEGTVLYPFSGPDLVTLLQLFPNAGRYVMVANQFAGEPAAVATMSKVRLQNFQVKFLREWLKFTRLGFFRTDDLNDDQRDQKGQIGVTTILIAFALFAGYDVVDVHPIVLEPQAGQFVRASGPWKSVRLVLRKGDVSTTVDYVSIDLSDGFLKQNQGAREWLANMSRNPVFLKAASHLLQMPSFTVLRDILAERATMVVQDETGLDYSVLSRIGNVELYGNFLFPHELFNRNRQASLAAAYKASKIVKPLPFGFSYNKTNERRSEQIVRRGTIAQ